MTVTVKIQPDALLNVLRHGGPIASVYVGARGVKAGAEWHQGRAEITLRFGSSRKVAGSRWL